LIIENLLNNTDQILTQVWCNVQGHRQKPGV